jgi:hypothetical protein
VVPVIEVTKRRLAGIDVQEDRPAPSAVAAVRTPARDVRFLPEGRGPVAAITGADPDLHAVEEHRLDCRMGERLDRPEGRRSADRLTET